MKSIIKTTFAAIFAFAVACTKENNTIKTSAASSSANTTLSFKIGQHYAGGIIFYIDSTGQHGLIADTADLPNSRWILTAYIQTGATGSSIGKGYQNTKRIVFAQVDSGHYAALRCWASETGGYTDWFLPSKEELNKLYKYKNVVGGFTSVTYWSSTEETKNFNLALAQSFVNGDILSYEKSNHFNVRAIRSF